MTFSAGRRLLFSGSFERVAARCPPRRVALVDPTACLAVAGMDCRRCVDSCPQTDRGLAMGPRGPEVRDDCDGCAECVTACETVNNDVAIRIASVARLPSETEN